ncbi:hypothetical protein GDO81_001106 [Engystomops pustulosus]|uniref:Uncharacterized protein n=1 Tax=Engystomops pustulosus TaxID=76066 RepID=A0AAV7DBV8_ENGPU|nr:hypothetical protein GDO81_001106 [Engystomops pustulosus]
MLTVKGIGHGFYFDGLPHKAIKTSSMYTQEKRTVTMEAVTICRATKFQLYSTADWFMARVSAHYLGYLRPSTLYSGYCLEA